MKWKDRLRPYVRKLLGLALVLGALAVVLKLTVLRPPKVMVARVMRRNVVGEVEGTGTVTVDVLAQVSSKIKGRVEQVFDDEGDLVRKGQVLAVLDQTDLVRRIELAQANLRRAQATAWEQKREWEREQHLVETGAVSVEESQQYRRNYQIAESDVGAAQADLGYAQYELSLTKIPSLIGGVVTKRWIEPGDSVVEGQPMFTVADTRLTYVDANIDQDFTADIRTGESATVILRGGEADPIKGRVFRIDPEADPATEEMIAEVTFPISPSRFQLGQWAQVYIHTAEAKDALTVPEGAIMTLANQRSVFVLAPDNRLRRVPVNELAASPRSPMVAVAGKLRAGDQVVVMPMGLKEGERVSAQPMPVHMGDMSQTP
jgi:RND family efflux transporter MFP subunit